MLFSFLFEFLYILFCFFYFILFYYILFSFRFLLLLILFFYSISFFLFHFSWSGAILIPYTGYYWFHIVANDMARLFINGDLILDHISQKRVYREKQRRIYLHANLLYELQLEYVEIEDAAFCHFFWSADTGKKNNSDNFIFYFFVFFVLAVFCDVFDYFLLFQF